MLAAADAAAKLMQLRQPEPLRMLDHHDARVRYIDADLDDRRRHEDVEVAAGERVHDPVLLVLFQASVQQRDAVLRKDVLREVIGHRGGRPQIDFLRLFNEWINDVGLTAFVEAARG